MKRILAYGKYQLHFNVETLRIDVWRAFAVGAHTFHIAYGKYQLHVNAETLRIDV